MTDEPIRFSQVFRDKPHTFVERGEDGELASLPEVSPEELAADLERAAQGDGESQYRLSIYYRKGMGVDIDIEQGYFWLQAAANTGFVTAQGALGAAYMTGDYFTEDREAAIKWLTLSAAQGSKAAEYFLRHPMLR